MLFFTVKIYIFLENVMVHLGSKASSLFNFIDWVVYNLSEAIFPLLRPSAERDIKIICPDKSIDNSKLSAFYFEGT